MGPNFEGTISAAVLAEREACAKIADEEAKLEQQNLEGAAWANSQHDASRYRHARHLAERIATKIRARGKA